MSSELKKQDCVCDAVVQINGCPTGWSSSPWAGQSTLTTFSPRGPEDNSVTRSLSQSARPDQWAWLCRTVVRALWSRGRCCRWRNGSSRRTRVAWCWTAFVCPSSLLLLHLSLSLPSPPYPTYSSFSSSTRHLSLPLYVSRSVLNCESSLAEMDYWCSHALNTAYTQNHILATPSTRCIRDCNVDLNSCDRRSLHKHRRTKGHRELP